MVRRLTRRFSGWVLAHPAWWVVTSGAALVLLGAALGLRPIVVIMAGAAIGGLNVVHARRRGSCPLPTAGRRPPGGLVRMGRWPSSAEP